jgi:hypothetical protein
LEYLLAVQRYFGAGSGSQVVERLPCKFKALNSNPGTAKKIKGYFFHSSRLHVLLLANDGMLPFAVYVPWHVQLDRLPLLSTCKNGCPLLSARDLSQDPSGFQKAQIALKLTYIVFFPICTDP